MDYVFDEMSNGVFTKKVEEAFSTSSIVTDLNHIRRLRILIDVFTVIAPS